VPTETLPTRGLGRSVPRLPGEVARGWPDLEHAFVAYMHGAGFRPPRLADVPDVGAGDRHHPCVTRFAVVGSDRRGAVEGLTIGVGAGWALKDDVAAWHPTQMKPPILWLGDPEAQIIIVGIGPTDQDLPPTRQRVREQADLLGLGR
jgi:hypothetical protein